MKDDMLRYQSRLLSESAVVYTGEESGEGFEVVDRGGKFTVTGTSRLAKKFLDSRKQFKKKEDAIKYAQIVISNSVEDYLD